MLRSLLILRLEGIRSWCGIGNLGAGRSGMLGRGWSDFRGGVASNVGGQGDTPTELAGARCASPGISESLPP